MITIRYLNSGDIPAAEEFCDIYEANPDWRVGIDPDDFIDGISEDTDYFIGAFVDDELVGVVTLGGADGVVDEATCEDALFSDLYVIPEKRSSGIGARLIEYALSEAAKEYTGVYGDILDDNLYHYYKRFGFQLVSDGLIYKPL